MKLAASGVWEVYDAVRAERDRLEISERFSMLGPDRFEMRALVCANHVARVAKALERLRKKMGWVNPTRGPGWTQSGIFDFLDATDLLVAVSHLFTLDESMHRDTAVRVSEGEDVRKFICDAYAGALGIVYESEDVLGTNYERNASYKNENTLRNMRDAVSGPLTVRAVFMFCALGFKNRVRSIVRSDFDDYACEITHGIAMYENSEFALDTEETRLPAARVPEGVDVFLFETKSAQRETYDAVETMCEGLVSYVPFDFYDAEKIYAHALGAAERMLCSDAPTSPRPEHVYALLRAYDAMQTYLCPCWPTTFPGLRAARWDVDRDR